MTRDRKRRHWVSAALGALLAGAAGGRAHAEQAGPEPELAGRRALPFDAPQAEWAAYMPPERSVRSDTFWWPTLVLERGSTHPTGSRSLDETRLGLMLGYRTRSLSPHVRALVSPSLGALHNLAAMAGAGFRVHVELAGVALSYGVGLHVEVRLRDSLWLSYATPVEIGTALFRGQSAEHFVFFGARRPLSGALINSFLLDPNGYDNEDYLNRLDDLRHGHAWQLYVSLCFGRRVE